MSAPRAVVYGVSGSSLTADERAFLRDADPLGVILFARNCETAEQVRALTRELRETLARDDAPVLIDQEGGTVMRLRPPQWHDAPDAERLGNLYRRDPDRARAAARSVGALFGAELRDIGIDVDCAPVADLGLPETTGAIGTRAYSSSPEIVAELARAMAEGLMGEGCLPVVKHLPGHGRARVDSHRALPRVDADLRTLRETDFAPFHALQDMPLGMVAHVVFGAVDPDHASSVSATVISDLIRGEIGFDGFLFSDDIVMSALSGRHADRAEAALRAGCDAVLHCSGDLAEMRDVAGSVPELSQDAVQRWTRAMEARSSATGRAAPGRAAADHAAELDRLLGGKTSE